MRLNGLKIQEGWHQVRLAQGELELRFHHFLCGKSHGTDVLMRGGASFCPWRMSGCALFGFLGGGDCVDK